MTEIRKYMQRYGITHHKDADLMERVAIAWCEANGVAQEQLTDRWGRTRYNMARWMYDRYDDLEALRIACTMMEQEAKKPSPTSTSQGIRVWERTASGGLRRTDLFGKEAEMYRKAMMS